MVDYLFDQDNQSPVFYCPVALMRSNFEQTLFSISPHKWLWPAFRCSVGDETAFTSIIFSEVANFVVYFIDDSFWPLKGEP